MEERINQLFVYVQERCLWQFFSRSWDREENIDGILTKAGEIFAGQAPKDDTPADRCNLADAKVLVSDFRSRFPWIKEASSEEIKGLLSGLKEKLVDTTITHSKNRELRDRLY